MDAPCRSERGKWLGVPPFSTCTDFERLPSLRSRHTSCQKLSSLLFHPQFFCLPCGLVVLSFIRFISNGARCLDSWVCQVNLSELSMLRNTHMNFKINLKNSCVSWIYLNTRLTGKNDWNKLTFIFLMNVSDTFLSLQACSVPSLKHLKQRCRKKPWDKKCLLGLGRFQDFSCWNKD